MSEIGFIACPNGILIQANAYNATSLPNRITIASNSFDLCTTNSIQVQYATNVNITGNRFEGATGTGGMPVHVYVLDSAEVVVSGNQFNGGGIGVQAVSAHAMTHDVNVTANVFSSQYNSAIDFYTSGMPNCAANSNVISNDTTANNGYSAINIEWPNLANGNMLTLNNNGGAITSLVGILLGSSASTGGGGSYAIGNVVRGTAQYGIQTYGGSAGSVISGNLTTATTPLSIGGGTVTTPATFGTPTIAGRAITVVPVVSGGAGYSGTPYIGAIGGGGSGFTLTPVMSGGAIASVTVTSGGTGFSSPPTIYASGNFVANNQTVL